MGRWHEGSDAAGVEPVGEGASAQTRTAFGSEPMEGTNREAWARPNTLRRFARSEGWSDPGEREAIDALRDEMAGRRILDLGVGAGRTVPLLRAISPDYRALDFLPPMADACRRRFPGVDVAVGDARDLGRFDDGSFDLVTFSWNGIDAVAHEDRAVILAEVHRTLAHGGAFQYSTHNIDGPGWQERPWTVRRRDLRHPRRLVDLAASLPVNVRNHHRNRVSGPSGPGWGMANASAHHFSLVIHYTTLAAELRALAAAGLSVSSIRSCEDGRELEPGDDLTDVWWFQLTARKP